MIKEKETIMKDMKAVLLSLRVDTPTLKGMKEGASEVFTERECDPPGTHAHGITRSFSERQFKTERCYLIGFNPKFMIPVILVTRGITSLNKPIHDRLRVFTYKLKNIRKGKSRIYTERKTVKNPGSTVQGFARYNKLKFKTWKCLLLIPKSLETLSVVIVTKLN